MNIFATYPCPYASAKYLNQDKVRRNKMIVESAQILSTAAREYYKDAPENLVGNLYKSTHKNHPCVKWVAESTDNYIWLLKHAFRLSAYYRNENNKLHATSLILMYLKDIVKYLPPGKGLTPFKNVTDFKDEVNVHKAYRMHLKAKWDKASDELYSENGQSKKEINLKHVGQSLEEFLKEEN